MSGELCFHSDPMKIGEFNVLKVLLQVLILEINIMIFPRCLKNTTIEVVVMSDLNIYLRGTACYV